MLGEQHSFTQKMELILQESSDKVQGIMERQEARAIKYKGQTQTKALAHPRALNKTQSKLIKAAGTEGENLEQLLDSGLVLEDNSKPSL